MGGYLIISLQNGLEGYRARLGADIVVVPSSSQRHGTVDNVLLQGITGNYYIPQDSLKKLESIKGIEKKHQLSSILLQQRQAAAAQEYR